MSVEDNFERGLIADRLKKAREYLQLSQEEVARQLGVPRTAISLIESGDRRVEALELQKLAHLYQRTVGYFVGDEAEEFSLSPRVAGLARIALKLSRYDCDQLIRFAEDLRRQS